MQGWIDVSGVCGTVWLLAAAANAPGYVSVANATAAIRPDLGQIFAFLFLMLGPVKVIGPFVKMTRGLDAGSIRRLAFKAFLISMASLILAAIAGAGTLDKFNMPVGVLGLSGGLILFLVAIWGILKQYAPQEEDDMPALKVPPSRDMALSPLSFPTIVTPYGVAALIIFTTMSPDLTTLLSVCALVLLVMLSNLAVMLTARQIVHWAAVPLQIFGTVLSVTQVALGLHIILISLDSLGLI
jgi:multiple antibiotic resistance protein